MHGRRAWEHIHITRNSGERCFHSSRPSGWFSRSAPNMIHNPQLHSVAPAVALPYASLSYLDIYKSLRGYILLIPPCTIFHTCSREANQQHATYNNTSSSSSVIPFPFPVPIRSSIQNPVTYSSVVKPTKPDAMIRPKATPRSPVYIPSRTPGFCPLVYPIQFCSCFLSIYVSFLQFFRLVGPTLSAA